MKRRPVINLFDIILIAVLAAVITVIAVFVSPNGKTTTVKFTLSVKEGNAELLTEGDVLNLVSGGCLGSVSKTGAGRVTAAAEAEYHAGRYYSGAAPLKEGGEYVICVGINKFVCTLDGITKR